MSTNLMTHLIAGSLATIMATGIITAQEQNPDTVDAALLQRLKSINATLSNRVIEPSSPEGEFLDTLPDKRPFSDAVLDQLIQMVDIKAKVPLTTERQQLTTHSPCSGALIASRPQSLPRVLEALKNSDLSPHMRAILTELADRIAKSIAGDERKKERHSKDTPKPTAQDSQTVTTQPPLPVQVELQSSAPVPPPPVMKPSTTKQASEPKPSTPSGEPALSTPWSVVAVLIVVAGLAWLLLKRWK